jgi:hypothetical protein
MDVFSRATTILVFVLLCIALVIRGIEFTIIAAEKIRRLQPQRGPERNINTGRFGAVYRGQPYKPNRFQLTQRLVIKFVRLSLYSVAAFPISLGVDHITRRMEASPTRWALDFIIIALIWFSPYEIQRIKHTGISSWPISICWIVSVLYGSVGLSVIASPGLWISSWTFIDIFWSASVTTLKLMLFLHLVLTQVSPWYQSLPRT